MKRNAVEQGESIRRTAEVYYQSPKAIRRINQKDWSHNLRSAERYCGKYLRYARRFVDYDKFEG